MTDDTNPEASPLCDGDPLARALAKLRPAPAGIEPHRFFYRAGQAARDPAVTFWRRAFLAQCVLLVAVGCGVALLFARISVLEDQANGRNPEVIHVPAPPPAPPAPLEEAPEPRPAGEPPAAYPAPVEFAQGADPDRLNEYLRIRREVLTAGLGLLPDAKPRPAAPVNPAELEKSLGLPPGVLAAPQWRPVKPTPPDAEPPPE